MKMLPVTIEKKNNSWCICIGLGIFGTFRTKKAAEKELVEGRSFYEFHQPIATASTVNTIFSSLGGKRFIEIINAKSVLSTNGRNLIIILPHDLFGSDINMVEIRLNNNSSYDFGLYHVSENTINLLNSPETLCDPYRKSSSKWFARLLVKNVLLDELEVVFKNMTGLSVQSTVYGE